MDKNSDSWKTNIQIKMDIEHKYDIEEWYENLKEFTFKTQFIPVTIEEGLAIRKNYRSRMYKEALPVEYEQILQKFLLKIQQPIQEYGKSFIRLSTRSPKDSALDFTEQNRQNYIIENLAKILKQRGFTKQYLHNYQNYHQIKTLDQFSNIFKDEDLNEVLSWLFDFQKQFLIVDDQNKALDLLCTSERILIDLGQLLTWKDINFTDKQIYEKLDLQQKQQNLCFLSIRQWEEISDENEQFQNGIIDFYINTEKEICKIIELNPFNDYKGAGTGGALYDWNTERDILEGKINTDYQAKYIPIKVKKDFIENIFDRVLPMFQGDQLLLKTIKFIYEEEEDKKQQQKNYCTIF